MIESGPRSDPLHHREHLDSGGVRHSDCQWKSSPHNGAPHHHHNRCQKRGNLGLQKKFLRGQIQLLLLHRFQRAFTELEKLFNLEEFRPVMLMQEDKTNLVYIFFVYLGSDFAIRNMRDFFM
ncbi:hypothetical protein CEXT_104851 [Caerostris extrusa]|uniref:Uncharacterized protein n=1 Tax=Caerostris extrusa TaxID=172846 RepID=A0AAV4XW41_CAEEX|nr:hypothetical protein CEXT_104851 [Caerostris extrusa]